MNKKQIHTYLKLGYAPISNYEFYHLKQEKIVQEILAESDIYVICQREELTFENIMLEVENACLRFEIHKKGSDAKLECVLKIYQENIEPMDGGKVALEFGRHKKGIIPNEMPINDIKGIRFFRENESGEMLLWITPDKFLHHFWNGMLEAVVIGDYREFTKFKVHYVGESTDQEIWKRLTGHEKLQDALTLEESFHLDSISTHEIMLLLFEVARTDGLTIFGGTDSDVDSFVQDMLNSHFPSKKTVALDVEKALINALKPSKRYNKMQYKQYPFSKDGLYSENFDLISYKINEDLTIEYTNAQLIGDVNPSKSTTIVVEKNAKMRLAQGLFKDEKADDNIEGLSN